MPILGTWKCSHTMTFNERRLLTSFHSCGAELGSLQSRVTFTAKINVLTLHSAVLHLHSGLVGFVGRRANKQLHTIVALHQRQLLYAERNSHVQVLLSQLDVSLDLSVNVEVELLGHREWDQRRSLRVWLLTAKQQTHKKHTGINCERFELEDPDSTLRSSSSSERAHNVEENISELVACSPHQ